MMPCWSCGSEDSCFQDCFCAKCIDAESYEEWKENHPLQYLQWKKRQADSEKEFEEIVSEMEYVSNGGY